MCGREFSVCTSAYVQQLQSTATTHARTGPNAHGPSRPACNPANPRARIYAAARAESAWHCLNKPFWGPAYGTHLTHVAGAASPHPVSYVLTLLAYTCLRLIIPAFRTDRIRNTGTWGRVAVLCALSNSECLSGQPNTLNTPVVELHC